MKKLHHFLSLFLLAMVGMSAQAATWIQVKTLTSVEVGKKIVLSYTGQESYLCGVKQSSAINDDCVYVLEQAEGTADSHPLYVLKQVSTGMYLKDQALTGGMDSSDLPPHGSSYRPPYVEYTADVTLAYTFTCLPAATGTEDPRCKVDADKGLGLVENAWVLCCADLKDSHHYYLGSVGDPFLSTYTDTNQWVFTSVITTEEKLNQMMTELFPNGINTELYPVGTNPGEFTQAAFDEALAAYSDCENIISTGGNLSVEKCNALVDRLRSAYETLMASAVPVTAGYYWILGGPSADRGIYNAYDGLRYTSGFTIETETQAVLSKIAYIWQVVSAGDGKYYLRNCSTSQYVGTVDKNSTIIPVTSEAQETYTFLPSVNNSKGGIFDIINTTRGTGVSFNTDPHGTIVFWVKGDGDNSYFKMVSVAADQIEYIARHLMLQEHYNTARALYEESRIYTCSTDIENGSYAKRGLVTQASQLSSNALQETPADGQGYAGLVDRNFTTYFHSRWQGNAVNEYHYLQADLTKEVQAIALKMSQRDDSYTYYPLYFEIHATNNPDGEWINEGAYTMDWKYSSMVGTEQIAGFTGLKKIRLSVPYRYIRFVVTETNENLKFNGYPFFNLSEFDVYELTYDAAHSTYEGVDAAVRTELEAQMAAAKSQLAARTATQETIDALRAATEHYKKCAAGLNLQDSEAFANAEAYVPRQLTYTREFTNTNWQALYVPFAMNYEDWQADFDVAGIKNMHQYDDNEDGTIDRTELEIIHVKGGAIKANRPYLIRAKEAGTKTLTLTGTRLEAAAENSIDCSSVDTKYTFTGTYSGVSGTDMVAGGYYALAGGMLKQAANENVALGTFRWYMKAESRDGSAAKLPARISLRMVDPSAGGATGIEETTTTANSSAVEAYTLDGRKAGRFGSMDEARKQLPKGFYIVNGKKVLF